MSSSEPSTPVADCPFCAIASATPPDTRRLPSSFEIPLNRTANSHTTADSVEATSGERTQPDHRPIAHVLLSTPNVLAFLDHAPIARGHTLVIVRNHREKLSDVKVAEGSMLGKWLGVVSRAVVGALEDEVGGQQEKTDNHSARIVGDVKGDWNVVQNNGARAAQVVPHVHFHIIPRTADVPEVKARSWTVFGKGQREDLDDEDAASLVAKMRIRLAAEVQKVQHLEGDHIVKSMFEEGDWAKWERRWSKL